jgi:hypothetical protein
MVARANGQSNDLPSWINDFPSDDELWGIGAAKLVNSRNSMNLAELRARGSIVSQLYAREFEKEDDIESNNLYIFFMACVNLEVSFEMLNDTRILRTWEAPDGTSWCLVAMYKSDARKYTSIMENVYQEYYDEVFNE